MARRFWPNQDPVGKRFSLHSPSHGYGHANWITVVGVVGNVREFGLERAAIPEAYYPEYQDTSRGMSLVIRTATPPLSQVSAVRGVVRRLDKDLPIYRTRELAQIVSESSSQRRFVALLLTLLASIALTLAAIGIYGVVAYSVASRQHEIGVRIALGAQRTAILGIVVWQGLRLALIGVGIGVAAAFGLTRFLSSLLYGVKPTDPITFIAVSLILIAVALLACYIPARRAATVDPMVALRHE